MADLRRVSGEDLSIVLETLYVLGDSNRPLRGIDVAKLVETKLEAHLGARGLSRGRLNDRITKVEKTVAPDFKLFRRSKRGGWRLHESESDQHKTKQLMRRFEAILEGYRMAERSADQITVSIGCSETLGGWLVPEVCRSVKEDYGKGSLSVFEVEFSLDTPHVVRHKGIEVGQFDIVVASYDREPRDGTVVGHVDLPMRLLINRQDSKFQTLRVVVETLARLHAAIAVDRL